MDEQGDRLERFCADAHPRLVAALTHYTGDRYLAEECAQEALIRACDRWGRVGRLQSPAGWCFRVGANLATSQLRRRRAERRALDRTGRSDPAYEPPDAADRLAEDLLRWTAQEPATGSDARALVARGLRRRRIRYTGGGMGLLALLAVALLALPAPRNGEVDLVGQPAATTTTSDSPLVQPPSPVPPSSSPDPSPDPTPTRSGPPSAADLGDVVLFDDDGLRLRQAGREQPLWEGPVGVAHAAPGGAVVFQPDPVTGPTDILVLDAGATEPRTVVTAGVDRVTLHGVVVIDDAVLVSHTRRTGPPGEGEEEALALTPLAGGPERPIAITGGLESGVGAVVLVDQVLVVAECHIQCSLVRYTPEGAELSRASGSDFSEIVQAAAVVDGQLVLLVDRFVGGSAVASSYLPELAVVDPMSAEVRRRVELGPDPREGGSGSGAVAALADGRVVVSLRAPSAGATPTGWAMTLLVDLTAEPAAVTDSGLRSGVTPM